jgi:GNAT superfamily N-acetyltransferase
MDHRPLAPAELDLLRTLDRSERIEEVYRLEGARLALRRAPCEVHGFDPAELEALIARQRRLLAGGGVVLGAFEGPRLAGVASVERRLRGARRDRVKMDILYVGAPHRGQGVARALVARAREAARAMGAAALYVSATPTRRTGDCYLKCGAPLAEEVDPELVALEPDDIHLELPVDEGPDTESSRRPKGP